MPFTISRFSHCSSGRIWAAVAAVGGAALLSGCVVAPLDDGYTDYGYTSTTVYTSYGHPPPPRVEYRSLAPSPHHVWVGGDWLWTGQRYNWRPGRWAGSGFRPAPPPRPHIRPIAPPPPRPQLRPDDRPRPAQIRPGQGAQPPQLRPAQRPPSGARPQAGARPEHARPDGPRPQPNMRPDGPRPQPNMRSNGPRPDNARPAPAPRADGGERRPPPQRRDRDEQQQHQRQR